MGYSSIFWWSQHKVDSKIHVDERKSKAHRPFNVLLPQKCSCYVLQKGRFTIQNMKAKFCSFSFHFIFDYKREPIFKIPAWTVAYTPWAPGTAYMYMAMGIHTHVQFPWLCIQHAKSMTTTQPHPLPSANDKHVHLSPSKPTTAWGYTLEFTHKVGNFPEICMVYQPQGVLDVL